MPPDDQLNPWQSAPKIDVGQDAILSYSRFIFVLGGEPRIMATVSQVTIRQTQFSSWAAIQSRVRLPS